MSANFFHGPGMCPDGDLQMGGNEGGGKRKLSMDHNCDITP